jgi:uncharacterized protein
MKRVRIGLISDTHGLLRPEAVAFLQGSAHIIHAGDIGSAEILEALGQIAPVIVVRGNNDTQDWADDIPLMQSIVIAKTHILVIHDLKTLQSWPTEVRIIVSGHSHKPQIEERDGVMFVNPGSAGRRRFKLPIAVGEIVIDPDGTIHPRIRELDVH